MVGIEEECFWGLESDEHVGATVNFLSIFTYIFFLIELFEILEVKTFSQDFWKNKVS